MRCDRCPSGCGFPASCEVGSASNRPESSTTVLRTAECAGSRPRCRMRDRRAARTTRGGDTLGRRWRRSESRGLAGRTSGSWRDPILRRRGAPRGLPRGLRFGDVMRRDRAYRRDTPVHGSSGGPLEARRSAAPECSRSPGSLQRLRRGRRPCPSLYERVPCGRVRRRRTGAAGHPLLGPLDGAATGAAQVLGAAGQEGSVGSRGGLRSAGRFRSRDPAWSDAY